MRAVIIVIVIVALLLLAGLIYVLIRNGMVASRNRVDESWSGIDVQLKRRHDLVPNLVEAVKGYASHESKTFEEVTAARASAMKATGVDDVAKSEAQLGRALANVQAVAEQYPDLKATQNFQQLSSNLSELEDEIQAARRIYNSNVQAYNTKIQVFPNSMIAERGGFTARQYFEITDAGDREAPTVNFTGEDGGAQPAAGAPPAADAPPAKS